MKRRPGGLGRGLDALIPARPAPAPAESGTEAAEVASGGALEVSVAAIQPNPDQPRARIPEAELADLAASIRVHGVLQPVIVTRADDGYVLVAGERRWRAAQLAGLAGIPALVKEVAPRERLELAIVENVQRQDLTPLEEAAAYRQLVSEHGLTQDAVAARVGKSRVAVANALRLLRLAPAVHDALADGRITAGHARALLGCPDAAAQEALLARVLVGDLSVRATEEAVRRGVPPALPPSRLDGVEPAPEPTSPEVAALERELRDVLATKVQLYHSRRGGRIVIHYYSDEEFQGIYERLTGRP
ncbi:MAG TPA: ParB/RepB/Spo0J family partition protein [Chloroflexota bacterium]|jgi:ParB family chromosome partitioning protein